MPKYFNSKAGGLEDVAANMTNYATENGYQDLFKKELEKTGVGIGSMSPKEKSAFFNKIDTMYKAKDEAIDKDGAYAIGMAQAKKSMNDEPPLDKKTITKGHEIAKSILKKEEMSQKDVDKFHRSLDNLVHKSLGKSSDEKKEDTSESADGAGDDSNAKINSKPGEKKIVDPAPMITTNEKKTWNQLKNETAKLEGYMTRMKKEEDAAKNKKETDTEEKITPVEMNPKVDYRF